MNLNNIIMEQVALSLNTEDGSELNKDFDLMLRNIFSPKYYKKIEKNLKNNVKVQYFDHDEDGAVAYSVNGKIFVSRKEFAKLPLDRKLAYLAHEYMHILQRQKSLGIFSSFPE